jgi:DHA2 family multidrug resistance protein-like MFS transporter
MHNRSTIPRTDGLAEPGLPMPRRLLAVASISAGSVLYTLDANIANVALPVIADALRIERSTAVLLVSTYNLVLAMVLLPLAAIGERLGHRRIFTIGLFGYLAASTGCVLSTSFGLLLAFRAVQALAAAGLLSVSLAMVRLVYPPTMLGRGLGFNTMAATLGAAVAAPLGGLLLAVGPWQGVFAAGLPLALLGLATSRALPDPEPRSEPYDTRGAVLCALSFGLLIASLQALSQGAPGLLAGAGVGAGAISAAVFVWHERRTALPVLPVDLLAQPALALSVAGALLAVLSSTVLMIYLPFRLHGLGFGSAEIGAMIAPYAVAAMIAAPASGMLSDRVSPSVLGTIGLVLATIGLFAIAWLPGKLSYGDLVWRMGLCGLGFSMFFSPNGRLVVGSVPRGRAASASSLISTTRMFGQALGSTALAGLLALGLAASAPALAAALLAVLALACSAGRIFVRPVERL